MPQEHNTSACGGGSPGGSLERKARACGIVVLGSNRELVYVDTPGRQLLLRLKQREKAAAHHGVLPKSLAALVQKILALRQQGDDRGWKRFTMKLNGAAGECVSVQALAQPRESHTPRPVIVLMMQSGDTPVV